MDDGFTHWSRDPLPDPDDPAADWDRPQLALCGLQLTPNGDEDCATYTSDAAHVTCETCARLCVEADSPMNPNR